MSWIKDGRDRQFARGPQLVQPAGLAAVPDSAGRSAARAGRSRLGPVARAGCRSPYSPHYTNAVFRGWYDFGGGSIADMGHYSLWVVFRTLKLALRSASKRRSAAPARSSSGQHKNQERLFVPAGLDHPASNSRRGMSSAPVDLWVGTTAA